VESVHFRCPPQDGSRGRVGEHFVKRFVPGTKIDRAPGRQAQSVRLVYSYRLRRGNLRGTPFDRNDLAGASIDQRDVHLRALTIADVLDDPIAGRGVDEGAEDAVTDGRNEAQLDRGRLASGHGGQDSPVSFEVD
jgi:hypothetical protein